MKQTLWTLAVAAAFGTLLSQAPIAFAHVELEATLDDDQEIPDPNVGTHSPSGTATLVYDFETKTVQYDIQVQDLTSDITAAHFHKAPEGQANPVPLACCALTTPPSGSTTLSGTTGALSDDDVAALFSEGLYVNVHTADNGPGEIRGQITLAEGQCDCDGTRKEFTKCVKDAIKALDKEDKKSDAVKALKKAVKRSFCGKRKAPKKAVGCCLDVQPVENIVTGKLCAAVPAAKCAKFGGESQGEGSNCDEPFCSPSGAFLDDSNLF